MNLNQIQYLSEVNRYHSLRQASEHLYISPQALSQSLSALEKELEIQIIDSSRTGTFLTPAGKIILDAGEEFLRIIDEVKSESKTSNSYKHLANANFDILSVSGVANTLIAKVVTNLYQEFPKIQVQINSQLSLQNMLDGLSQDTLKNDIAFISVYDYKTGILPDIKAYRNLIFKPLVSSRYCCYVPNNHEIANYKNVSLSTVLKYPIVLSPGAEDVLLPLLKQFGTPKKVITIPEHSVYNQFIQQDNTYLSFTRLLPSFESITTTGNRKPIPLKETITISMGYVYRVGKTFSPTIVEFLEYITRFYANRYGEL